MTEKEQVIVAASWEFARREENRGKAKDDKKPAISSLTGDELEHAMSTGELP